jgi:hypothetical protein
MGSFHHWFAQYPRIVRFIQYYLRGLVRHVFKLLKYIQAANPFLIASSIQ